MEIGTDGPFPARRRTLAAAAIAILATAAGGFIGDASVAAQVEATPVDYGRAEQMLGWNLESRIYGAAGSPEFLGDTDRFWYEVNTRAGTAWILVSPGAGTRTPLFDNGRLASAMSMAGDTAFDPGRLSLGRLEVADDAGSISFTNRGRLFRCDTRAYACQVGDTTELRPPHHVPSPDGAWEAFIHEYDLWVSPAGGGDSIRLTTDGEEFFQYGESAPRANQQIRPNRGQPALEWSPDSRRIAVRRMDERDVKLMALYSSTHQRPEYYLYKYAVAGDSVIPMFDTHVVDVEGRTNVRADLPQQPSYSGFGTQTDDDWHAVDWAPDGSRMHLIHTVRARKRVSLHTIDPETGAASDPLARDSTSTFVELNLTRSGAPNVWISDDGDEVIWFSERDGWAHLYRLDGEGNVLGRITEGPWTVGDLLHVNPATRTIWFTARGREPGRNPYYAHLYRVQFDGSGLRLLTPEDADHTIDVVPSGSHFVDRYSNPGLPGAAVLRRATDGSVTLRLEETDAADLVELGWTPPRIFSVKARDGVTDLWGLMLEPTGSDRPAKIPVIVNLYPGPQIGSVGSWSFDPARRGELHALTRLGFVVVQVDALGTPYRSKWFHTFYHGNMGDNGIADQVTTVKQLGARHPHLDLDRVGIFGHSGGGFSSTGAILRYPDFFKVAVSGAGNHDNRSYSHHWGEQYHGLMTRDTVMNTDNFVSQANPLLIENLKGKLLLMHGDMDDNVHPAMTLQVVDALIDANKSFDLIIAPNRAHGLNEPYFIRRRWDYFVEHLLGRDPPVDYTITRPAGP